MKISITYPATNAVFMPVIAAAAFLILAECPARADSAQPGSVPEENSRQFDRAITDVISQSEYAWRMPRTAEAENEETASILGAFIQNTMQWLKEALRPLRDLLRRFAEWLRDAFNRKESHESFELDWRTTVQALLFIMLATAASILGIILFRLWKNRKPKSPDTIAKPRPSVPDLLADRVPANELPLDEWMAMAREFLEKGEYRLAIRAMFLACLVRLSNDQKLTIAPHKSNMEYIIELRRRAHDMPQILSAFTDNVTILERIWYGMHEATQNAIEKFSANHERILDNTGGNDFHRSSAGVNA